MVDILDIALIKKLLDAVKEYIPVAKVRKNVETGVEVGKFHDSATFLLCGLLSILNGASRVNVGVGRRTYILELGREGLISRYGCTGCSTSVLREYRSRVILAKLDISYGTSDIATLSYSIHLLPHISTEESRSTPSTADVVDSSMTNYMVVTDMVYKMAILHMTRIASPQTLLTITFTVNSYGLMWRKLQETFDKLRKGEYRLGMLEKPRCRRGCRVMNTVVTTVDLSEVARIVKKVCEEYEKDLGEQPNLVLIRDSVGEYILYKARRFSTWSTIGDIEDIAVEISEIILNTKRELIAVSFLDTLKPQTLTLIYMTIL